MTVEEKESIDYMLDRVIKPCSILSNKNISETLKSRVEELDNIIEGVIFAREGREDRFTTEELLVHYAYSFKKGHTIEAVKALIRDLRENLVAMTEAGIKKEE
jgi:hypothetical protein